MLKLYEINDQYIAILDAIAVCEDPETLRMLEAERDALDANFEDKAVNIVAYMKNNAATAETIQIAIKDLQAKLKRHQRAIERNRDYLLEQLKRKGFEPGGKKITKSPYYDIGLKYNPEAVDIQDADAIPEEYIITERSVNKQQIKYELQNGVVIPGVALKRDISLKIN